MRANISMPADLIEDLLHDDKLVGHEREHRCKLGGSGKSLDIRHSVFFFETKQVPQHGIVFFIELLQPGSCSGFLAQNTFLNNLINRRRRQRKAGLEASLNPRKLVDPNFDHVIQSFLAGANHPNFALAAISYFFGE